jgi:hypothetical protein
VAMSTIQIISLCKSPSSPQCAGMTTPNTFTLNQYDCIGSALQSALTVL